MALLREIIIFVLPVRAICLFGIILHSHARLDVGEIALHKPDIPMQL